ncbi:hypothetical protein B9J78_01365 [bacterium Unc6]|nr:hypothetical protein [bacterium Unc6]
MSRSKSSVAVFISGILVGLVLGVLGYYVASYRKTEPVSILHEKAEEKKIEKEKLRLLLPEVKPGKIAIILDDWGHSKRNLPLLYSIQRKITIAVLPDGPYSTQIAKKCREKGLEVILHLPMASGKLSLDGKTSIRPGMTKDEVSKIFSHSFSQIPNAVGVNNHMGSFATKDEAVMRLVLDEVKSRRLFFIDSVTSDSSVADSVRRKMGIRGAKRAGLFLDIDAKNKFEIEQRLIDLANIAKKNGKAVGIGHAKQDTLKAILRVAPRIESEGVRFVFASEVVE